MKDSVLKLDLENYTQGKYKVKLLSLQGGEGYEWRLVEREQYCLLMTIKIMYANINSVNMLRDFLNYLKESSIKMDEQIYKHINLDIQSYII